MIYHNIYYVNHNSGDKHKREAFSVSFFHEKKIKIYPCLQAFHKTFY